MADHIFAPHLKALNRYGIRTSQTNLLAPVFQPINVDLVPVYELPKTGGLDSNEILSHSAILSLLATPQLLYSVEINVGTPPQKLRLELDTGSQVTWVFGPKVPQKQQKGHVIYDPAKSRSYVSTSRAYTILYQDASNTKGSWAYENLNLGGVRLTETAFGVASNVSPGFVSEKVSGLLALSLDSATVKSLGSPGILPDTVFTLRLAKYGPSDLILGSSTHSTKFASMPIHYVPLVANTFRSWRFRTMGVKVNGKFIPRRRGTVKEAVIDSGTALVYMDPAVIKAIYDHIPGSRYDKFQEGYLVPRGTQFPSVTMIIDGQEYQIPSTLADINNDVGHGMLFGQYQSTSETDTAEYYGVFFLQHVLAVHDFKNRRIGFARRTDVKYDNE